MCDRYWLAVILVCLGVGPPPAAHAGVFPGFSVDSMSGRAAAIVEGRHEGKDTIRIVKVYKGQDLLGDDTDTVEVIGLAKHGKALWGDWKLSATSIDTERLVVFLERTEDRKAWTSMATIDDRGACGSCGVFWFDDLTCYGYQQAIRPGPYRLFAAKDSEWRTPKTIDDLRAGITQGLANSQEWNRTVAIADPVKKAESLARYLLVSTSPKGDKGSYRYAVREPMRALGKDAVPSLITILASAPSGESLDEAVLILYDIGPAAAEAVPVLRKVLSDPKCDCVGYVLSALGSIGDVRALPDVERYRDAKDLDVAQAARKASAKLREQQKAASESAGRDDGEPGVGADSR